MTDFLPSWLSNPVVIWGLGIFSVVAVLLTVLLVPRYLARLPRDYLHDGERQERSLPLKIARNALGVVLVLLGLAMLILPGQGILTLLAGVLLLDFPGKQRLVKKLLGRPKVLDVVNKLRARHGAPKLEPA